MLVEEQTSYKNLHTKIHYIQRRRWGFCITGNFEMWIYTYMIFIFIYVDIPFKKYNLCQVSSTSFVQSVRSSKLLLCCWVVKLSHRFTFASSWFLSRHSSYHVILPLLGELTDLCLPRALRVTVLDISRHKWRRKSQQHAHMLMWCHGDVLKFSTPKNLHRGHFLISLECSNSCVDTMNGWLQTKVAWLTRCSPSQRQRCLLQWLGRERLVAVLHQAIGNIADISFINSMLLRFSSLIIRWSSVWIMKMVWRWYDFCFSHGPMFKFQFNGRHLSRSSRSWKLASWRIPCWTVVPAVCRKSPSSSSGGWGRGGRWDNSNSIPKIVVGLSQVGWNLDWFQWSTQVLCSCFFCKLEQQCECSHSSTWLLLIFAHAWWATYNFNIMSGVQRCLCLSILCDTYVYLCDINDNFTYYGSYCTLFLIIITIIFLIIKPTQPTFR